MNPPPPPSLDQLLEHRPFVRSLARQLTSDRSLADDLEQEAWITALRRPPRHQGAVRAWFSRVLRNAMLDEVDSDRRRAAREVHAYRDRPLEPEAAEGDQERTRASLAAALRALPEHYAEVVRLRYYEGLSAREIAHRLDLPLATVRTRLRRSVERMREWLDRRHGNDRERWLSGLFLLCAEPPRRPVLLGAIAGTLVVAAGLGCLFLATAARRAAEPLVHTVAPPVLVEPAVASAVEHRVVARELVPAKAAPEPVLQDQDAGLELAAVWADGSPAAGIGLQLEPIRTQRQESVHQTLLPASGKRSWSGLSCGRWMLLSTGGEARELELEPGELNQVELQLGEPRPLSVRVSRPSGSMPAGYEIHLSVPGHPDRMIRVGYSDADGLFELPHFDPRSWIMAGGSRRAMSSVVSLDHPRFLEPFPQIELPLVRASRSLQVTVRDPEGSPVAGAMVRLGNSVRLPAARGVDGLVRIEPQAEAGTRGDGTRELLSRTSGPVGLDVWHPDFAPWSGIVGDDETELVVQLAHGARVLGAVRGSSGEARPGATVRWRRGGRSGTVLADSDGRYRLPPLPAGPYELTAFDGEGPGGEVAAARLELADGGEVSWSPHLERAPLLRGHALDACGRPMTGCAVALLERRPPDPVAALTEDLAVRWAVVDARGEFCFAERATSADAAATRCLFLFRSPTLESAALGWLENVPVGAQELTLGPRTTGTADARLAVSIRSCDPTDARAELLLTSPRTPLAVRGRAEGGTWHFDGLTGGEWSVLYWGLDSAPQYVGSTRLAPGQALDLEVGVPDAPGRLEVLVVDEAGEPASPRSVELVGLDGPRLRMEVSRNQVGAALSIEEGGHVYARVPAGDYLLVLRSKRWVDESRRVTIRPGECVRREVALTPGTLQVVRVELPGGAGRARELWLDFRTPDGELRLQEFASIQTHARSYELARRLPDEDLVVHARLEADGTEVASATRVLAPPFQRSVDEPLVLRLQEPTLVAKDVRDR